jgi:hypothetical protein
MPQLREALALGDRIRLMGRSVTILITPLQGMETLTARTLTELRRDF